MLDDRAFNETRAAVPAVLDEGESANPFVGLFDIRFRRINSIRMVPLVYCAIIALDAAGCAVLALAAFRTSTVVGVLTLVLACPIIFFTVLMLWRTVLEFILAMLVLPAHLSQLSREVSGILGTTTTIVGTTTTIVGTTSDISSDTSGLEMLPTFKRRKRRKRTREEHHPVEGTSSA